MNLRLGIFGFVVVTAIGLAASLFYVVYKPQPTTASNPISSASPAKRPIEPTSSSSTITPPGGTAVTSVLATSTISVPGMSQYINSSFGFSFWYPSSWILTQATTMGSGEKTLTLSTTPSQEFMSITESNALSGHYLFLPDTGGGCVEDYYYNSLARVWLQRSEDCDGEGTTTAPQDPEAPYTMGGLPIFPTYIYYIVPITTDKFLQISFTDRALPLVQTIKSLASPLRTPDAEAVVSQVNAKSDFYAHYSPEP